MNILNEPFRPYFILTSLVAILVPMYFVGILINDYPINETFLTSFAWHGHEMVFGFTSALLTGFLLTASAKWTGKKTFSKGELVFSILIWLLARFIVLWQPNELFIILLAPLPFIYLLIKMLIILFGQKNLIPVSISLMILIVANYLHIDSSIQSNPDNTEVSYKLASLSIFTFLYIFSGRLLTFFTNNKFQNKKVEISPRFSLSTYLLCFIVFILDIFFDATFESLLSLICAILLFIRAKKLAHSDSLKDPMLLILNAGHLFLPIFFSLKFLSFISDQFATGRTDIHSLFAGALGLISLGMITRVSLGHTGRPIIANKLMKLAFFSTALGAILRVFHPIYLDDAINIWLHTSMGFWTLGFIFYLINFSKILTTKRL